RTTAFDSFRTSCRRSPPGSGECCARRTRPTQCSSRADRRPTTGDSHGPERGLSKKSGSPLHHVRRQGRTGENDVLRCDRLLARVARQEGARLFVDPQASLTDIFQRDIFGKGPVKIMENLWAQEIDADSHIKAYQDEIRKKILDMYGMPAVP